MNSEGEGGGRKSKVKRQKSACHGVAPRRREGGLMFDGWSGCRVGSGENSTFLELAGWGERFSLHPVAYGPAELFRNDAALGRNQSPNHFLRPSCGTYSARARPQGTDPGRDLTVFVSGRIATRRPCPHSRKADDDPADRRVHSRGITRHSSECEGIPLPTSASRLGKSRMVSTLASLARGACLE
jgi:hypothetical protein